MNRQPSLVALPRSNSTEKSTHSKKLEWAIRDFITLNDSSYYDDELDAGILLSYFKVGQNICVKQKIHIRQDDYVCYTTLSCHINPKSVKQINHFLQTINGINVELDYGNFEIDMQTGEIRFRTYYEPDEKVYMEALDKLLGYPMYIIKKYAHLFQNKTEP